MGSIAILSQLEICIRIAMSVSLLSSSAMSHAHFHTYMYVMCMHTHIQRRGNGLGSIKTRRLENVSVKLEGSFQLCALLLEASKCGPILASSETLVTQPSHAQAVNRPSSAYKLQCLHLLIQTNG